MPLPRLSMLFHAAFLAALALGSTIAAAGGLEIRFVNPERYTDASLRTYHGADERVLRAVERHLQALAGRCLAPGETLAIQVLDIDLAGRQQWSRRSGAGDMRVMREIDWPRMELAYALRGGDGEVASGHERLSDMEYLMNSAHVRGDSSPIPYERIMLTKWFEQRFCR